ncbi:MAG: hypothetical protein U9N34_08160, partial [Candidatus Cloacimonadota bacterium]|nr:hypothetical protein [Candidatus Cloacimonadota bacterium]
IQNISLMSKNQIQDWGSVIKNTRTPSDEPMKKVWSIFNDSIKTVFNNYDPVEPFSEKSRYNVVEALNSIIKSKDFYSEEIVENVKLNREARNLLKEGIDTLEQLQIQRLNRIILESVLPFIILESNRYNKPSDRLFENILAEINEMIENNLFDQPALVSQIQMSNELQIRYDEAKKSINKNRIVLEAAYSRLIAVNKDEFTDHLLK